MTLSFDQFSEHARDYQVIPLIRERIADCETPISLAAKLRHHGRFFLLESMEGGETWGRYSILGFDIRKEFLIRDDQAWLHLPDGNRRLVGNPVEASCRSTTPRARASSSSPARSKRCCPHSAKCSSMMTRSSST
jgi:anthranilate/para-aminobenzoate synthase component I